MSNDLTTNDLTTNDFNLDLFIKLVRGLNLYDLENYLDNSWNYNKLKTLAIIFNSRDRINGKKEKEISNNCLLWLKLNHNDIYKKNIHTYINKYGCWNDLNFIIKKTKKIKKNNYEYKLFAEQLKKDKELLENGENISLCAKWIISPNNTKIIKIARYLFTDISRYQERYRKEYIIPLRTKLNIIETKLCTKDYENIDYNKIPAKALTIYNKTFIRHDEDKYKLYLSDIANNKCKMKISGLLPYEIIKKYIDEEYNNNIINEMLELQWKTYVDMYKFKIFDDIIPIVDVSGSMLTSSNKIKPLYVSIAMGLLLAEINKGELHNKIMTFSEKPIFFNITGDTLKDKIKCILSSPYGLNTNFLNIADLLINSSIPYKRIICFTDMQFDNSNNSINYNIQDIHNKFMTKFTENNKPIPELIYWNLNGDYSNYPINNTFKNTSIISGFSEQLLNIILECDEITPNKLMDKTLEPYYDHIIL